MRPARPVLLRALLLSGVLWCLPGGAARADGSDLEGRRVRIFAPTVSQKRIVGVLRETDESRIVLERSASAGDTLGIPHASIRIVEVHEGRRSNMLLGAVAGLAAGAALGAGVDLLIADDAEGGPERLALGIGVGVGFVIGTLVGITSENDVWKRIPPERLQLALEAPGSKSFGVTLAVRF